MDVDRFDTLARSLSAIGSRRRALALALSGTLVPLLAWDDATAHDTLKKCKKIKDKKKKQACIKKAKKHNAQHASETSAAPPPTGPTRKTITQTFTNAAQITIPPGAPFATSGPALPYPSVIAVAGFANGRILDVNLTLHGFSHTWLEDVNILLVAGDRNAVVMSDVGGNGDAVDVTLTLDDQAATELPLASSTLATGTFRPTNRNDGSTDFFPAPAPAPSGNVALSTFNGGNPNGSWQLFVVDDSSSDVGNIERGWSLQITAEVDA